MTTNDMKAELEAAGYTTQEDDDAWQAPDQFTYFIGWESRESLETAYAHLQQQRELAALRDYVKQIHHAGKLLPPTLNVSPDSPIGQIARVVWRSFAYLERFNITADESDET